VTEIVIPEDPDAGPLTARKRDGWRVFNWMRHPSRTGRSWATPQIQDALDIPQGFSTRLGHARGYARRYNEFITDYEYVGGLWVIRHLHADAENRRGLAGYMVRDVAVTGQIVNLAGQGEWLANNADDPMDREYAELRTNLARVYVTAAESMQRMARSRAAERRAQEQVEL
jgi:hypothetical protein